MKTTGDCHDLYLKNDFLQLADVFEKFGNTCLKHRRLDPVWYYTASVLAWDTALKVINTELEEDTLDRVFNLPFKFTTLKRTNPNILNVFCVIKINKSSM